MYNKRPDDSRRHSATPYRNQGVEDVLKAVEQETRDHALAQNIYFGPTAMTHIRRLIEMGGSIIADTSLIAGDIDAGLLGDNGAKVLCFIDDPQVVALAEQRRVTRAAVAADVGLSVPGPKLMVIGSAPAALNRIIQRRQHEPMSDVCVLAAPTGFASVIQLKERLLDCDLTSIVVRGKKGGISAAVSILNAILREIAEHPNPLDV